MQVLVRISNILEATRKCRGSNILEYHPFEVYKPAVYVGRYTEMNHHSPYIQDPKLQVHHEEVSWSTIVKHERS